ncbi:MAG: DUF1638 domain-containing protein [Bacillota bacterium]|jgi:RNA polymerase-binding transcription factor DksA
MSTVILSCSSLERYVDAAQAKMNTDYPVIYVDKSLHSEPKRMKDRLEEIMRELEEDVDTVLAAMGYCGGSWEKIAHRQRLVIPCVDDCITLFLHTGDERCLNKKEAGHMYICDKTAEGDRLSIPGIRRRLLEEYGERNGTMVFEAWFKPYHDVDVIDTGCYDCHSEEFLTFARESADLILADLHYVDGSNRLLEKLVGGEWDEQFVVVPPEKDLTLFDFIN